MTEFSGVCPPREGGFVICLECGFEAGIAEHAATYVPEQPAERTTEIPVVSVSEFPDADADAVVVAGPWGLDTPGRHSVDAPTGQIPRVPVDGNHLDWPGTRVGVEAPGSAYLPGTSTPGGEGIASAA